MKNKEELKITEITELNAEQLKQVSGGFTFEQEFAQGLIPIP